MPKRNNILIIIIFFTFLKRDCAFLEIGDNCTTPDHKQSVCIPIYSCSELIYKLKNLTKENLTFLRNSQCGFNKNTVIVCCPNNLIRKQNESINPTTRSNYNIENYLLPNRSICGIQGVSTRIFGGLTTEKEEFPWLALIRYRHENGNLSFDCGGTLITQQHVLTAAHCVINNPLLGSITPYMVRLGEWDLNNEKDCVKLKSNEICNTTIDVHIEKIIVHSLYNSSDKNKYNDIALIRLDRKIEFTDYIKPICLPSATEKSSVGARLLVAGWGQTEDGIYSNVKLKLAVPVINLTYCSNIFKTAGVKISENQICAGGEEGQDSCTGDSGGPLMALSPNDNVHWYIEGIISFGTKCGTKGWPGVHILVSKYIKWITENLTS